MTIDDWCFVVDPARSPVCQRDPAMLDPSCARTPLFVLVTTAYHIFYLYLGKVLNVFSPVVQYICCPTSRCLLHTPATYNCMDSNEHKRPVCPFTARFSAVVIDSHDVSSS